MVDWLADLARGPVHARPAVVCVQSLPRVVPETADRVTAVSPGYAGSAATRCPGARPSVPDHGYPPRQRAEALAPAGRRQGDLCKFFALPGGGCARIEMVSAQPKMLGASRTSRRSWVKPRLEPHHR